jgi:cytochrome P450
MESQTAGPMNATAQGLKAVPGDGGWPLLGTTLEVLRDPIGLSQRFHERFGPVFWTNQFGIRITVLMGPEGNEFALRNAGNLQLSGPAWQYYIGPFFNRGLMLLDGEEHRLHRGIMQAAFRKAALAAYVSRMNPDIGSGIAGWAGDRDFRALPRIKQLTLDLATTTFMGQQLGEEAGAVNRAFVDTVRAGSALLRFAVPGGAGSAGWTGGACWRSSSASTCRRTVPAAATTCSRSFAAPRMRRARASPTTMSSTT